MRTYTLVTAAAGSLVLASPALAVTQILVQAGATGNTAGFYTQAVRYFSPVGVTFQDSGPLNGNTATHSPGSAPAGLTTFKVAGAVNGTASGSSEASANLQAGTVGAKAASNTFNGVGNASAELYEDLQFFFTGGGTRQVTATASLDGSIGSFANANSLTGLSYNMNFGTSNFSYVSQGSQLGFAFNTGTPTGWDSFSFTNVTETGFDFTGKFTINDGEKRSFSQRLYLICQDGVTCDFLNTGRVGLQLPAGVSFTSGSGVFLQPPATGAVPEPASWAMMISGFGLTGGAMRRRRRLAVGVTANVGH
jgi:hypothetical protein